MRDRINQAVRTPEIAIPLAALAIGLALLILSLVLIRPDSTTAAALVAAVAGLYGTILSLMLTRYFERQKEAQLRRQELDDAARAKKIPEYEKFVAFLFGMFFAERLGQKPMTSQQMMKGFIDWTKPLLLWGSDEVVTSWGRLRVDMGDSPGVESLFRLEELLFQLRRDVGHPGTELQKGDLLRLWVNDIDEYIEKQRAPSPTV